MPRTPTPPPEPEHIPTPEEKESSVEEDFDIPAMAVYVDDKGDNADETAKNEPEDEKI
jgi:hypothetical protein